MIHSSSLIDLHTHSNASDGSLTPTELIREAVRAGLKAIALTDHDTMSGIPEAADAAAALGIELIPGIEFSTNYEERDIHIVGLQIDHPSLRFSDTIEEFRLRRTGRNQEMVSRMRDGGIDISMEAIQREFGEAVITRAHMGRYLVSHGYAADMNEAFQRFIGDNAPYFVTRYKCTPVQAVSLIRDTGGIPVLAHPFLYHLSEAQLQKLIGSLREAGLAGIEVYYSTHSEEQTRLALKLARMFGLCPSGGSDFHGAAKPDISLGKGRGNLSIPYQLMENLRRA